LQEQLKAETHISEAAFRSLKLEEDDFKSKLKESDGVINNMKKQLERKDAVLQNCNETLGQLNRTVQELVEKEKELQATIDGQTKTLNANNRTVQELGEIRKQLQANIDGLTKTVEALNRTVQLLCEHPKDVSTCKVETISTSKWTEIPPAINIANFRPNNIVWYTYSASIIRACVAIFISRLCLLRSTPISYPFSTVL